MLAAWLGAGLFQCASFAGDARANEIVRFHSAVYPPTPLQLKRGAVAGGSQALGQPLTGRLKKPDGTGPFPAVILLHGCGGIWRWDEVWSDRLAEWGYVALSIDSLGPRGMGSICDRPGALSGPARALDAHGAKTFLASVSFVDRKRIAVLGMSHGGWAALEAIRRTTTSDLGLEPFQAAVTLYPWCGEPSDLDAPLLILIGDRDDWSPVARCSSYIAGAHSSAEAVLKVYPGAHHLFDLPGVDMRENGHVLRYNVEHATDAIRQVREFLARHL